MLWLNVAKEARAQDIPVEPKAKPIPSVQPITTAPGLPVMWRAVVPDVSSSASLQGWRNAGEMQSGDVEIGVTENAITTIFKAESQDTDEGVEAEAGFGRNVGFGRNDRDDRDDSCSNADLEDERVTQDLESEGALETTHSGDLNHSQGMETSLWSLLQLIFVNKNRSPVLPTLSETSGSAMAI